MRSVEFLIVFAVTALHFAVVAGCVRPDEFVPDTEFRKDFLKECRTVGFGTVELVGIIRTVVGLNTQWHKEISQRHDEERYWKNRYCVPQRLQDNGNGNTHR